MLEDYLGVETVVTRRLITRDTDCCQMGPEKLDPQLDECLKYSRGLYGELGYAVALQTGRSRVRFSMVPLKFFIDIILPAALWPWGSLSL